MSIKWSMRAYIDIGYCIRYTTKVGVARVCVCVNRRLEHKISILLYRIKTWTVHIHLADATCVHTFTTKQLKTTDNRTNAHTHAYFHFIFKFLHTFWCCQTVSFSTIALVLVPIDENFVCGLCKFQHVRTCVCVRMACVCRVSPHNKIAN